MYGIYSENGLDFVSFIRFTKAMLLPPGPGNRGPNGRWVLLGVPPKTSVWFQSWLLSKAWSMNVNEIALSSLGYRPCLLCCTSQWHKLWHHQDPSGFDQVPWLHLTPFDSIPEALTEAPATLNGLPPVLPIAIRQTADLFLHEPTPGLSHPVTRSPGDPPSHLVTHPVSAIATAKKIIEIALRLCNKIQDGTFFDMSCTDHWKMRVLLDRSDHYHLRARPRTVEM